MCGVLNDDVDAMVVMQCPTFSILHELPGRKVMDSMPVFVTRFPPLFRVIPCSLYLVSAGFSICNALEFPFKKKKKNARIKSLALPKSLTNSE